MSLAFTSAPSSRQYFTAAIQESGALREELAPHPKPAATISGVTPSAEGVFGSAPAATRIFMACTSLEAAARQNGVAPFLSTHSWLCEVGRNHSVFANEAFGFAPCASNTFIKSR